MDLSLNRYDERDNVKPTLVSSVTRDDIIRLGHSTPECILANVCSRFLFIFVDYLKVVGNFGCTSVGAKPIDKFWTMPWNHNKIVLYFPLSSFSRQLCLYNSWSIVLPNLCFRNHKEIRYVYHKTCTCVYEIMMTSSRGNIFRVTGHLCGEFTDHRWIPHKGQWLGALMFSLIFACIG